MSDYVYLWQYRVAREQAAAFEKTYGPHGEWVRLFRRAQGYLGTELFRDGTEPTCYVTLDRWRSRQDFEAFRARCSEEFEALDARCEMLTLEQRELGHFERVE